MVCTSGLNSQSWAAKSSWHSFWTITRRGRLDFWRRLAGSSLASSRFCLGCRASSYDSDSVSLIPYLNGRWPSSCHCNSWQSKLNHCLSSICRRPCSWNWSSYRRAKTFRVASWMGCRQSSSDWQTTSWRSYHCTCLYSSVYSSIRAWARKFVGFARSFSGICG